MSYIKGYLQIIYFLRSDFHLKETEPSSSSIFFLLPFPINKRSLFTLFSSEDIFPSLSCLACNSVYDFLEDLATSCISTFTFPAAEVNNVVFLGLFLKESTRSGSVSKYSTGSNESGSSVNITCVGLSVLAKCSVFLSFSIFYNEKYFQKILYFRLLFHPHC